MSSHPTPPASPRAILRARPAHWVPREAYPLTVALLDALARPWSHRARRFLAVRILIAEGKGVSFPPGTWTDG